MEQHYNNAKYTNCSYSIDGSFNCCKTITSYNIEQFTDATGTIQQLNAIDNKIKKMQIKVFSSRVTAEGRVK